MTEVQCSVGRVPTTKPTTRRFQGFPHASGRAGGAQFARERRSPPDARAPSRRLPGGPEPGWRFGRSADAGKLAVSGVLPGAGHQVLVGAGEKHGRGDRSGGKRGQNPDSRNTVQGKTADQGLVTRCSATEWGDGVQWRQKGLCIPPSKRILTERGKTERDEGGN